ncbi:uncharacterized protein LOC141685362 [Apium graveolens]|uniref:uncharacterized protein LOC141685362 n=1 Tax=Apium graveolens TaxID=4045 RepID=UPI003D78BBE2
MLNQRVARFNGCYKRVQEVPHSGWSDELILENAHVMYKYENKTTFQLIHCWRLLKNEPKWSAIYEPQGSKITKVSESGAYTSESNTDTSDQEVREVRPTGQETAKRKAKGKAKNDSSMSTFMEINERKASALEKLVVTKEKEAEDNRMTKYMDYLVMDTSYMTPEQKKNHESLCAHIRTNILKF